MCVLSIKVPIQKSLENYLMILVYTKYIWYINEYFIANITLKQTRNFLMQFNSFKYYINSFICT